jgi:alginate O-acetyltransferase complex protein AlgJ
VNSAFVSARPAPAAQQPDRLQWRSGLLRRNRRLFGVLAFGLLAAPLIVGIIKPDNPDLILKEGRRLAPAPNPPATLEGWQALPGEIDAYLKDRFGLRQKMIRLHKDLTRPLVPEGDPKVLVGRTGRMFLKLDAMVLQSAGLLVRDKSVSDTADLLAAMRDTLARGGVKFLVAIPPNSATVYPDELPIWARSNGRTTEYDLLLEDLTAHGVKTVDLRPVMSAARSSGGAYYLHDTHWTPRGALAGFNAIVEADSHPDWRVDARSALGPMTRKEGGDLAWLLGVQNDAVEKSEPLALPKTAEIEQLPGGESPVLPDRAYGSGKPGPTIMVIGDSFTNDEFPWMLLPHVGRVVWLHHRWCGFDWKWIRVFHPDEVWWMPTERFLVCHAGARPADFKG